ncbi:hypothetical protein Aeh1gORF274c [Aeromonas phage Aeh1]|uniref:Uncharacterized protein n=1 Tax=Aeromonas phage Aeh1 TaxID=2880362 RepID=Q76YJ9_9CAUD|nr:hypothetical protein Aeh1p246 [Aeromonas phage Aeh1]AAQ17896.1 hypothetical protein Aeh1gORF274c [Aeromonas phage Aeh1]
MVKFLVFVKKYCMGSNGMIASILGYLFAIICVSLYNQAIPDLVTCHTIMVLIAGPICGAGYYAKHLLEKKYNGRV